MNRHIRTLIAGRREAGHDEVVWNGCDQLGRPVASGIYLLRLDVDGRVRSQQQCVLVR